jgi:uncharacterized membrane protein YphA (DoxX/SURF4 family)
MSVMIGGLSIMNPAPQPEKRLTRIARFLIAAVFILSGLLKLADLNGFLAAVKHYGIFGEGVFAIGVTYMIPWVELLAALSLFFRSLRWGAWAILWMLLMAFLALNLYAWVLGLPGDCGCFGKWDVLGQSHVGKFIRNLGFLYLLWLGRPQGRRPED